MFERFTERARQVIVLAQHEARALEHGYIGTEHILLGLLREEHGIAAGVLDSFGVTIGEVRAQVERIVGRGEDAVAGQIPFTPRAKKVLETASKRARDLNHDTIGTEHILLGLIRVDDGVAARILLDFDADAESIRGRVLSKLNSASERETALGSPTVTPVMPPVDPPPSAWSRDAARWQYDVRTLEGASDTWAAQLATWRKDGWELLSVVPEGEHRRAILERRV